MQEGQHHQREPLFTVPSPYSDGIAVWKIFTFLGFLLVFLFGGAGIICGTDSKCRNYVPTVQNMLNSTFATPFVVSGFYTVLGGHFVVSVCLYSATSVRSYYWSGLQLVAAALIYFCCVVTLFVLPFTGWPNNWANVSILVAIALWMLCVQVSMRRGLHRLLIGYPFVAQYVYYACVIPYIVVRAVPDIPVQGKDAGILVCEVVGGVALLVFMAMLVAHVWSMRIRADAGFLVDESKYN
jgi:hypothetical protein